jgi:hypothetical protein
MLAPCLAIKRLGFDFCAIPCALCGGQIDIGADFSPNILTFFSSIILSSFPNHIHLQSHCSEICLKINTDVMKTCLWWKTVTVPRIWSLEVLHFKDLYGTETALNGKKFLSLALPYRRVSLY